MRVAARIVLLTLLPATAFGQSVPGAGLSPEAAFEACVAGVDGAAIDAFAEDMLERHADLGAAIDAACADGRRDEAARLYAPLHAEYIAHPDVQRLRACTAVLDAAQGIVPEEPHVCDGE
ncbi:MAG: hypothetical protein RQ752_13310 [Thermohalobaculum sp.]|nr:hypothetical protein [Thermohalobaculum sp.]